MINIEKSSLLNFEIKIVTNKTANKNIRCVESYGAEATLCGIIVKTAIR